MNYDLKSLVEITKKLNILFIEDNKAVKEQLEKLFKNFFDNIDLANNAEDGFNQYKNYHKNNNSFYDLVITDISMPKLDDIELCKEITYLNQKQNIIVISAHTEKDKLLKLKEMGIIHILQKPIEHMSLIRTLNKIIENNED